MTSLKLLCPRSPVEEIAVRTAHLYQRARQDRHSCAQVRFEFLLAQSRKYGTSVHPRTWAKIDRLCSELIHCAAYHNNSEFSFACNRRPGSYHAWPKTASFSDSALYSQVAPIRFEHAPWPEIVQTSPRTSPKTSEELRMPS